jgi:hypothetical protein
MTTISSDNTVMTLVTIYEVESAAQQRLIDLLITTYEQFMMRQPGFISGHVLRGQEPLLHNRIDAVQSAQLV